MKRIIPILAVAALLVGVLGTDMAQAGLLDKWKNKDKKEDPVPRYDNYPTVSFYAGKLGHGLGTSWQLDDVELHFLPGAKVTSDYGDDQGLREGKDALVVGTKMGDMIVVHRVRVMKDDSNFMGHSSAETFIPSEVDPTVGEGTGPQ